MSNNQVTAKVGIYEIDGSESNSQEFKLDVQSHWNYSGRVVLQMADGKKLTVTAKDLRDAIASCTQ